MTQRGHAVSPRAPGTVLGMGVDVWSTGTGGRRQCPLNKVSHPNILVVLVGGCWVCVRFWLYVSACLPFPRSPASHAHSRAVSGCPSRHLALHRSMIHSGVTGSHTRQQPHPLYFGLVVIGEGRNLSPSLSEAPPTFPLPQPGFLSPTQGGMLTSWPSSVSLLIPWALAHLLSLLV